MWRYFRGDFLIYAAGKVIVGLSSFLLLRLLTNLMAPSEYGAYTLMFAIVSAVSILSTSALTSSITRFMPEALEAGRLRRFDMAVYQTTVPLVFLAVALTALALGPTVFAGFVSLGPFRATSTLLAAGLAASFQIYIAYANSRRARRLYSSLVIGQALLFVAFVATIRFSSVEPVAAAIASLAASYALALLIFRAPILPWRARLLTRSLPTVRAFLRYGSPLVALNIMIQLNTYLDQFMLRAMRSLTEVGLYAANYVVADKVVYALSSVISITLTPLIYREWAKGDTTSSYEMIWKAALFFVVMSVPVMAVMFFFGDQVMSVLTARQFAPGRVVLPYVLIGALMSGLASVFSYVLTLHHRTLDLALCYLLGLGVNFALDLALIPRFGILGCAYATVGAFATILVALMIRAENLAGISAYLAPALRSVIPKKSK